MKRIFTFSLLFVCLFGCKSASVDKDDSLRYNETMLINEVPRTTVTFFDISDSRCPINANCITAGSAVVDLALTGATTEGSISKHVNMCLGACDKKFKMADTLDYEFTGQKYRFILSNVSPFPDLSAKQSKADYTIKLDVVKQL